jgi:hypothetical protein
VLLVTVTNLVLLSLASGDASTEAVEQPPAIEAEAPPETRADALALAASVFPGVLLHGAGHYVAGDREAAWDLLALEGIALGALALGGGGFALTAAAEPTAPLFIPIMYFGGLTFIGSWLMDIAGVSGLSGVLVEHHPSRTSQVELGWVSMDDTQSPVRNLVRIEAQLGGQEHICFGGWVEVDTGGEYQAGELALGYRLFRERRWELLVVQRTRHQRSRAGFSLTDANLGLELDLDLGSFWRTLDHVYLVSRLGYGGQWILFDDVDDATFSGLLTLSQGFRVHVTPHVELGTAVQRGNNDLIGGNNYALLTFRHHVKARWSSAYLRVGFVHGRGYALTTALGVEL